MLSHRKPSTQNIERVKGHQAYRKFIQSQGDRGQSDDIPDHELLESLGCNNNTEAKAVKGRLELLKTRAGVVVDKSLVEYLNYIERRLRLSG